MSLASALARSKISAALVQPDAELDILRISSMVTSVPPIIWMATYEVSVSSMLRGVLAQRTWWRSNPLALGSQRFLMAKGNRSVSGVVTLENEITVRNNY